MGKTQNYKIEYPDLSAAADITQIGNAFTQVDVALKNVDTSKVNLTDYNNQTTAFKNAFKELNATHGAYCKDFDKMTTPGIYMGNYSKGASADCTDVLIVNKINGDDYSICNQIVFYLSGENYYIFTRRGIQHGDEYTLKWSQYQEITTEVQMNIESDERQEADRVQTDMILSTLAMQGKPIKYIPDTAIAKNQYSGNSELDGMILYLPNCKNIEYQGFSDTGIIGVIMPNIESITTSFWGCHKLESVYIPFCCKNIDVNAFSYCSQLKSILIDNTSNKFEKIYQYNCPADKIYLR